MAGLQKLLAHFRSAFAANPVGAYRDWYRTQEHLREEGDAVTARALADDLWEQRGGLRFDSEEARARFHYNTGVFFGSPGPAADLGRARECFGAALAHFSEHGEDGWRARVLHNFGTSLSNLGTSAAELTEAIGLLEAALAWRTAAREVARAVTLHNMGLAWRRLAQIDSSRRTNALAQSAAALREALAIRERLGLEEGGAASARELDRTLAAAVEL